MKVIAIERGFYGGKIQEPLDAGGEPFYLTSEKHLGKWMEPQGWKPSTPTVPATEPSGEGGSSGDQGFIAARTGGGKFLVKDAAGQIVGDFIGTKAEAEAEAARLNTGVQSSIAPPPAQVDAGDQPTPTVPATEAGSEGDDPTLPDA